MEIVFVLLAFLFVFGARAWMGSHVESEVRDELRAYNIDARRVGQSLFRGGKYATWVDFEGTSRLTGEPVSGHAVKRGGVINMSFDGTFDSRLHLRGSERELPSREPDVAMDLESRIRVEMNRRLGELQSNREQFLANDADGDGMVDSEEWAAVRQRVEAEVRQELTAAESGTAPHHPNVQTSQETRAAEDSDGLPEAAGRIEEQDGYW